MQPAELWWLAEAKKPVKHYAGGLSENDVAELHDFLKDKGALNG